MTNNNGVKWFVNGEIEAACESCKFPSHDGPCGSASSFLNQDKIFTLNICCPDCRKEFYGFLQYYRKEFYCFVSQRESFAVKLTYEKRKAVFDNLQIDPDDFKALPDLKGRFKFSNSIQWEATSVDEDEFKLQLKDSIHNMSSSGQHLWKTMFGNVEESICLLWTLRFASSHIFIHQMAYFLSAIDIGDKARFLGEDGIPCIPPLIRTKDMYMLIPSVDFRRIKAKIVKSFDEIEKGTLDLAFLLFAVENQRELEQAGGLDKDQVGEIACQFGVQYVHVNSDPSVFSLDGYCPSGIMEISPPNSSSRFKLNSFPRFWLNSSSRFKLQPQNVRASAQLAYKIEVRSQNIEVSIKIRNVRCHIPSDDKEKYFPSRIQIRVIPSKDCEKRTPSLTVGKSSNDDSRTLVKEDHWEVAMQVPKGPADFKVGGKSGSSTTHTNWRFELNECLDNSSAGYFDWTLFDNANDFEVWNADSKNYKKLLDPKSSLRNRGSHPSSPFNSNGGCVFSEDSYGQPLTWSLDKRVEGTTTSWKVEMGVWLTYCYSATASRNDCFQTASWSFTKNLEMKVPTSL